MAIACDVTSATVCAPADGDATSATVCAPADGDAASATVCASADGDATSATVCAPADGDAAAILDAWAIEQLAIRLRKASALFTTRVARAAHGLVRLRAWQFYGFARLTDYAGLHHQRSARWFQDHAKLGEGLDRHAILEAAVLGRDGRPVGAVAATEILRVASAETIPDWIRRARQVSVRELKEEVRAQRAIGETAPRAEPGSPGALQDAMLTSSGNATEVGCLDASAVEADSPGHAASRATIEEDDPDIEPGVLFGFEVPRKVRLVFEDVLDLHRAVAGGETTVAAFVEALAAETAAGLTPPDCVVEPLCTVDPIARKEHALARITQRWAALNARDAGFTGTAAGLGQTLNREGPPELPREPAWAPGAEPPPENADDSARTPGAEPPPISKPDPASRARGESFVYWNTAEAFALLHQEVVALEQEARTLLAQLEAAPIASEYASRMEEARARHDELRQLLPLEDAIERSLARVLTLMRRRGDFMTLGFASLGHHAVERLGLPRRTAESRAGILHALRRLPRIRVAYESGAIGLTAAWVLYGILGGRPCDPGTQDLWVEHARRITVKRLKEEARTLQKRELATPELASARAPAPESAPEPATAPATEPTPEPAPEPATEPAPKPEPERAGAAAISPRPAGDAEWLDGLRRAPGDTRSRLRAVQLPGVEDANATLADLRRTDVFLRFRLPAGVAAAVRGALEASRRRLTALGRAYLQALEEAGITGGPPADAAGALAAERGARMALPASLRAALAFLEHERRVPSWAAFLALLEDYAETHDNPDGFPVRRWDPVYIRWGWVCRAPGCTVRVGIEDHHLVYRSHNGTDEIQNQIVLCGFHHHHGEHGEFMRVWGQAPDDVHWILGAPELAAEYFNERRVDPTREP